jgi:hypothetical protein
MGSTRPRPTPELLINWTEDSDESGERPDLIQPCFRAVMHDDMGDFLAVMTQFEEIHSQVSTGYRCFQ